MYPRLFNIPLPDWLPWIGGSVIPIHSYGVMVAAGMLVAIWVTVIRAKRAGVSPDIFYDIGLWSMVSGIAGARVAYVYTNWDQFQDRLGDIFKIWEGGQVLYGGLILAIVVNLWFLKRRNLPVLRIADLAAPALPLGIGIGRLGCFLNGCCWGKPASEGFPFGVRFPNGSAVQRAQLEQHLLSMDDSSSLPVHPSQIYATLLGVMLYVILAFFYDRRRWDGQILALCVIGYAITRMVEEQFRGDTPVLPRFWGTMTLTPGQYVSVYLLAAGVLCYLLWGAKGRRLQQDL